MGNWFADKLGPPPSVMRYQPGQPWPPQPQQVVVPQGVPGQQYLPYQPPPQPAPNFSGQLINTVGDLLTSAPYWQGTREEKANTANCPKCGGPLQLYTGLNAPKVMSKEGVSCHPMERCYYCGYNGHFEQLGQQATDSGIPLRVI